MRIVSHASQGFCALPDDPGPAQTAVGRPGARVGRTSVHPLLRLRSTLLTLPLICPVLLAVDPNPHPFVPADRHHPSFLALGRPRSARRAERRPAPGAPQAGDAQAGHGRGRPCAPEASEHECRRRAETSWRFEGAATGGKDGDDCTRGRRAVRLVRKGRPPHLQPLPALSSVDYPSPPAAQFLCTPSLALFSLAYPDDLLCPLCTPRYSKPTNEGVAVPAGCFGPFARVGFVQPGRHLNSARLGRARIEASRSSLALAPGCQPPPPRSPPRARELGWAGLGGRAQGRPGRARARLLGRGKRLRPFAPSSSARLVKLKHPVFTTVPSQGRSLHSPSSSHPITHTHPGRKPGTAYGPCSVGRLGRHAGSDGRPAGHPTAARGRPLRARPSLGPSVGSGPEPRPGTLGGRTAGRIWPGGVRSGQARPGQTRPEGSVAQVWLGPFSQPGARGADDLATPARRRAGSGPTSSKGRLVLELLLPWLPVELDKADSAPPAAVAIFVDPACRRRGPSLPCPAAPNPRPVPPTLLQLSDAPPLRRPQMRYASASLASNPEKTAKAHGQYLRTHFKNMREVGAALTGGSLLLRPLVLSWLRRAEGESQLAARVRGLWLRI